MTPRQDICRATADFLSRRRGAMGEIPVLLGFDGFVDEICSVVETRSAGGRFEAIPTIDRFAGRIARAAGQSSNFEMVVRHTKLGGNGPIMANVLARLGLDVTCVGSLGYPDVHPVFSELAGHADVRGIAPPAHTDALEFADGKLMLGKLEPLSEITWENIVRRLGLETFEHLLARSRLIGMVNWTMIPQMSRIWAKLIADVLPSLSPSRHGRRSVFIDLADPEKRTADDLRYALKLLARMQEHADVTLGMNLKEAQQVGAVLGASEARDLSTPALSPQPSALSAAALAIRQALNIDCCVIHPRTGAAAATRDDSASFAGPFVREPKISTGAGDHFNAGFMLGRVAGMTLEQALCTGVAASGHYVRTATSPGYADLSDFVAQLPEPQ